MPRPEGAAVEVAVLAAARVVELEVEPSAVVEAVVVVVPPRPSATRCPAPR